MTDQALAHQLAFTAERLEQPGISPQALKTVAENLRGLARHLLECGLEPAPRRVGEVLEKVRGSR